MDNISNNGRVESSFTGISWVGRITSPLVSLFQGVFGSSKTSNAEPARPLAAAEPHLKDEWKDLEGKVYATEECKTPDQKSQNKQILQARLAKLEEGPEKERVKKRLAELEKEGTVRKRSYRPKLKEIGLSAKDLTELKSGRNAIDARISKVADQLESGKLSSKQEQKLQRQLNFLINSREDPTLLQDIVFSGRKEFIGANDFRDYQAQRSFTEAEESFTTGLVNAHLHTQTDSQGYTLSQFARFGVMSDMSGGFYSIEFLKELKNASPIERSEKIDERIAHIESVKAKQKGERQIASCENAIARLKNVQTQKGELILDDMIASRSGRLEEQALSYLLLQLEGRPSPNPEEPLVLIDLRLLDQTKERVDKSGWVHGEAVEAEDHRAALAMLDGKTVEVVAEGDGPVILGERILLPERMAQGMHPGQTLSLETYSFHCSPQGAQENSGAMLKNNSLERQRLLHRHEELGALPALVNLVEAPKQGYDTAVDVLVDLTRATRLQKNVRQSVGCLSDKDRTGVTVAAANKILRQEGRAKIDQNEDILRPSGLAARVVKANTGAHLLKIAPKALLFDSIPGVGRARQARYLLEHAVEVIRGNRLAA